MRAHTIKRLFTCFLLLTLSGCTTCDGNETNTGIPKSIEGKILAGAVTSGTGVFIGMDGYTFETSFAQNHVFTTVSSNKEHDSHGDYTYKRIDDKRAALTLTDQSQLHQNMQLEVLLTFSSPSKGTFTGRFLSGETGEENGTFELK